jgi:hypothetical protein
VAGYDNTTFASFGPISLTSVDQAGHEIGDNAVRLLPVKDRGPATSAAAPEAVADLVGPLGNRVRDAPPPQPGADGLGAVARVADDTGGPIPRPAGAEARHPDCLRSGHRPPYGGVRTWTARVIPVGRQRGDAVSEWPRSEATSPSKPHSSRAPDRGADFLAVHTE